MAYPLSVREEQKAKDMLADYLRQHLTQSELNDATRHGRSLRSLFRDVLLQNGKPHDGDYLNFLRSEIWAISENLRTGLANDIKAANPVEDIRAAFRRMLEEAPTVSSPDAALNSGKLPYIGTAILSEALCKAHPDQFAIKNKRADTALRFILDTTSIETMSYSDFMDVSQQLWNLLADEFKKRNFDFDLSLRFWYVDRFYDWIYQRPETKEILG